MPPRQHVGDESEQSLGGDRRQAEHDDVGEAGVVREPDRVRVAGPGRIGRRVGRHRLDGEPVGLDHPLDLLGVRDVEVGQLHAGDGSGHEAAPGRLSAERSGRLGGLGRYRQRAPCTGSCCAPAGSPSTSSSSPRIVVMINLGFWQLRRLDERKAFNEQVSSRSRRTAAARSTTCSSPAPIRTTVEWRSASRRRARTSPDEQVVVVNRSQGGIAGDIVVTPLELDDGRMLLVERGFVPLGAGADVGPAAGTVEVDRTPASVRRSAAAVSSATGPTGDLTEVQRHRHRAARPAAPGARSPMYVELVDVRPGRARRRTPSRSPCPSSSEGPHLSYAVQWFIFAIAVAVGWVLAVRRSINDAAEAGSPPVGAAATTAAAAAPPSSSG